MVILGFRGGESQPELYDTVSCEKGKDGKGRAEDGGKRGGIKDRGGEGTGGGAGGEKRKEAPVTPTKLSTKSCSQSPIATVRLERIFQASTLMLLP